jgi:hypothetical protein
MGYHITIEIAPGSAEDRMLQSVGDPVEHLQKLVTRESSAFKRTEDSDFDLVDRLLEMEPYFRHAAACAESEIVARQVFATSIREDGISTGQ